MRRRRRKRQSTPDERTSDQHLRAGDSRMRGGGQRRKMRRRDINGRSDEQDDGKDRRLAADRSGDVCVGALRSFVHRRRRSHHKVDAPSLILIILVNEIARWIVFLI